MRVMVTGGTGFIGSHTVVALMNAGHQVRLLVRSEEKMKKVFATHGIEINDFVIGDVIDKDAVAESLSGCDAVIHSAAMVATNRKHGKLVHLTNVIGTKNVIGQAVSSGLRHIVYVSSVTAMHQANATIDENSPVGQSRNVYGQSKIECEEYVRSLQTEGAPIKITYPAAVIGPHDHGMSEPMVGLKRLLKKVLITSSGIQFVDVRDCADVHAAMLTLESGSNRFVLGGHYHQWSDLAEIFEKLSGRPPERLVIPGFLMRILGSISELYGCLTDKEVVLTREVATYYSQWNIADSSKLKKNLQYQFRDPLKTIADSLIWLAESGALKKEYIGHLAEHAIK